MLDDGTLNPNYDPDEAEEIIVSQWATNTGITVTRTTRAWSYPDYDDLIIFEYTFENTGDTDGDGVANTDETLYEVLIGFHYGVAPSMLGFQRWYGTWEYDFMYKNDLFGYFDRHRWLRYVVNNWQWSGHRISPMAASRNRSISRHSPSSGEQGGGLMSPQVPGIQMLFYDTKPPRQTGRNVRPRSPRVSNDRMITADSTLKQPFMNKVESGNSREDKMIPKLVPYTRWSGTYTPYRETVFPPPPGTEDPDSLRWTGRGAYNFRQSYKAVGHHIVFGPYILEQGKKIEFSYAEVVGYGATEDPNDWDEGGGLGEVIDEQLPWHLVPRWNDVVKDPASGQVLTQNYLGDYGYPDYVNSDVLTVKDVADMAYNVYTGKPPVLPLWPEDNSPRRSIPDPRAAPRPHHCHKQQRIRALGDSMGTSAARGIHASPPDGSPRRRTMYINRSAAIGPWTLLAEVPVGSAQYLVDGDMYEVIDDETIVGESQWYSVTSVDAEGNASGKTNLTQSTAGLGPAVELTEVHAVPNPFYLNSGFTGGGTGNNSPGQQIGFYGLPEQATIEIYSYSGQLVQTIEHDAAQYSTPWFQVTRNDQEIASGVYFFVVRASDGQTYRGKFVVIK